MRINIISKLSQTLHVHVLNFKHCIFDVNMMEAEDRLGGGTANHREKTK